MFRPYSQTKNAVRRVPFEVPVSLEIQYRVWQGSSSVELGSGRTVLLTSSKVVFETDQDLRVDDGLDASITWPVPLDKEIGLQLAASLLVTHTNGHQITAAIRGYQFKTRKQSGSVQPIRAARLPEARVRYAGGRGDA
jgi:hypothetical protein